MARGRIIQRRGRFASERGVIPMARFHEITTNPYDDEDYTPPVSGPPAHFNFANPTSLTLGAI